MKRQIRKNVFETNSSSTHAICISKKGFNNDLLPDHVTFSHGEFGWEDKEYHDTWSKASYLYQAICDCSGGEKRQEKIDKISCLLGELGISCDFEPDKDKKYGDGYIDHACETYDFVRDVLNSKEKLITYLFGDSFIITGNDNSDGYNDRMYINDGEVATSWGTYTNYGDLKPEFDDYEIYEKGN